MKKIILSALVALSLNPVARAQPSGPEKCPAINSIQTGGFNSAEKARNEFYTVSNTSNYDTYDKWFFTITNVKAISQYDAYTKANNGLATLSDTPQPTYINGHFGCHYNIGFGYYANAYTFA